MKKVVFMMSLLLTLGLFSACSKDNEMGFNGDDEQMIPIPENGEVLQSVDATNLRNSKGDPEVFYFFNDELPISARSGSFFVDSDKDECYVINNIEELNKIYCGDRELPFIDFEHYTLVIGQKITPNAFYPVLKQNVEFRDKKCQLNLYVPNFNVDNTTFKYFYFWALYPKFRTDGISTKIVKIRDGIKSIENITGYVWNSASYNKNEICYIYHEYSGTYDSVDLYYPINLPEEFKVNNGVWKNIIFSGEIVEMTDDSRESLHLPGFGGRPCYYVYLTKIEITE